MRPIGCAETSVQNCHSTLLKIPKERRYNSRSCLGMVRTAFTVCSLNTSLQMLVWVIWECTRLSVVKIRMLIVTLYAITTPLVTSAITHTRYLYWFFAVIRRVFQNRRAENCKQIPRNCGSVYFKCLSVERVALWFDKGWLFV